VELVRTTRDEIYKRVAAMIAERGWRQNNLRNSPTYVYQTPAMIRKLRSGVPHFE